ncbi:MAG TPA: polysaccharide biosynthesis/export family protein [Stellaceae bacterium]|nr:polysaccharide biosynthesis/export family protein [Stellaceae bacterium]
MRFAWLVVVAGLLLGGLAGCTPSAPKLASADAVAGGVPLTGEHVLAPGDEFEIRFPFYPDLNDKVTIGPDGRLSLQLINTVAVGGLTVSEATKLVNERYARVIRDPQATLTVRNFAPQQIFVDGWVANPGLVRSDVPLTVSRAIAQAGGTKSGAHTDAILVLRRSRDGKIHYYQVALGDYAGAGGGEDPILSSYDVVFVPKTALGSIGDFLANYVKNIPFYVNYPIQ